MPDHESSDLWTFAERAAGYFQSTGDFTDPRATRLLLTLNRASEVITYDLESSVHRPQGRSWAAFRIMFVTWVAGPLESKKAAELTGMSRAAVSNLTNPLVEAGVLARTRDDQDKRSVRLSLTQVGRDAIEQLFAEHNRREHQWAQVLTDEEQDTLVALLNKLVDGGRAFGARGRNDHVRKIGEGSAGDPA